MDKLRSIQGAHATIVHVIGHEANNPAPNEVDHQLIRLLNEAADFLKCAIDHLYDMGAEVSDD